MAKKKIVKKDCIVCGADVCTKAGGYRGKGFTFALKGDFCGPCRKKVLTAAGDAALLAIKTG